ncbi:MAG: Nre family DNA repair protein [Candidatus Thermoplasmatota archaeon]|nr:Nre family DNA repair protein [Candidatus Thermoplasmatota archaeon]
MIVSQIAAFNKIKKYDNSSQSVCALCRGTKLLCGKSRCPVLLRYHSHNKIKSFITSKTVYGSSPPSVFIGRAGYPKVSIGPLVPPRMGNTSLYDSPEQWLDCSLDEILDFRSSLIRGKHTVNVFDVSKSDKTIEFTRALALAENSVFTEAFFNKKPRGHMSFYDDIQPHGPSAPLIRMNITNPKYNQRIEKAYYDTDLKSAEAIYSLYKNGIQISKIQKAFSVGAFGLGKYRRFVPTRWSITAVDSQIGKQLMTHTRQLPWINTFRIYYHNQYDNRWVILMMPSEWQYELIEAWYPNTTWNQYGNSISIYNSYEFNEGRTTYADIGGCYYAGRLAVNETLNKDNRQAATIIFREAHPGYIMPIGVWNVRESVRRTLDQPYHQFDTLQQALSFISTKLAIPIDRWIQNSALLKHRMFQTRLDDFIG